MVGSPKGIADTIDEFIAAGCSSFCLSGYPQAIAAREFSENVTMPHFGTRMAKGLPKDRLN